MALAASVLLIGGPDVNARIELMQVLRGSFQLAAAGSASELAADFGRAGFEYTWYPLHRATSPLQDLPSLIWLAKIMRRRRPQIVHTFDTKPGVWGRLAARLAGIPVVIGTLLGLGSLDSDNEGRPAWCAGCTRPAAEACMPSVGPHDFSE